MVETPKQENFHQVARERAELRRSIRGPVTAEILKAELEELNKKAREFADLRKRDPAKAKELLKTDKGLYETEKEKSSWVDEDEIESQVGPIYGLLSKSENALAEIQDFEINHLRRSAINVEAQVLNSRILPKIREEKSKLQSSISEIEHENPETSRAFSLVSYKKGLHQEGHIAPVPSVVEYLKEIGTRMISGKPMFLHGPTGTGKTSLARYAAEHFTGQRAEMVYCNPQTRESNIWGKQGIRPAEGESGKHGAIETVDIYGPLARAMSEGKAVIFDEFTALPREQMVFLKGIFNIKIGDTVNIMGNGITKVAPGFQMIFTANLKSEKNPERQELPPEIAREFEQNNLEINYTPKDEAYDIMLARLMDKDGSVTLSQYDLNITLPQLCKAIGEIQIAYTNKTSDETARLTQTLDPGNKKQGLKKFVFTQGTIENILDAWKVQKQTSPDSISFIEFVDQRLKTALTFKEYPQPDRILAAKILASMGFLRTLTHQDLDLPQEVLDFDASREQRSPEQIQEIKSKSLKEERFSILELARFDPFNKRQRKAIKEAEEFLSEEERRKKREAIVSPEAISSIGQFLRDSFQNNWNANADQLKQFDAGLKSETIRPQNIDWQVRSQDVDTSKFGEYTINPDTSDINWETIPKEKIRIFPFTEFVGKPRSELADYIMNKWPERNKYIVPGMDYWKFVIEYPDRAPDLIKGGDWHYFFGSIFRNTAGYWLVPVARWGGAGFDRGGGWLGGGWYSSERVVLLEK